MIEIIYFKIVQKIDFLAKNLNNNFLILEKFPKKISSDCNGINVRNVPVRIKMSYKIIFSHNNSPEYLDILRRSIKELFKINTAIKQIFFNFFL